MAATPKLRSAVSGLDNMPAHMSHSRSHHLLGTACSLLLRESSNQRTTHSPPGIKPLHNSRHLMSPTSICPPPQFLPAWEPVLPKQRFVSLGTRNTGCWLPFLRGVKGKFPSVFADESTAGKKKVFTEPCKKASKTPDTFSKSPS